MDIQSLSWSTDLMFFAHVGAIVDRGDYLVVHTPENPGYYWGNHLFFPTPPQVQDISRWRRIFADELGHLDGIEHEAYGWDSPEGVTGHVRPFLDSGFALLQRSVLTASEVHVARHHDQHLTIRPVRSDPDWEAVVQCATTTHAGLDASADRRAGVLDRVTGQMAVYRAFADAGRGQWFAAFKGDVHVGNLGIFTDGRGTGRFQEVVTHPEYRRQGVCCTLVHHASRYAFDEMGVTQLALATDDDGEAKRIYQYLGFTETERQVGLQWPA